MGSVQTNFKTNQNVGNLGWREQLIPTANLPYSSSNLNQNTILNKPLFLNLPHFKFSLIEIYSITPN